LMNVDIQVFVEMDMLDIMLDANVCNTSTKPFQS
jgi:hypothetical protein